MSIKLNIYKFTDYREVLKALILQRKNNRQTFSYRWFSQKAGLSAPNFLNLVVKGKRHLSGGTIEKVIEVFQLSQDEGNYFRCLVHFNKAKTLSEKEHFAGQIVKFKKFLNEYPLSKDQFEYYSDWYNIPVRELLNLKNPPHDEVEISQQLVPAISKSEALASLQKLMSLGMVEKKGSSFHAKHESVATGNNFSSYGVVQYHKKMLGLAGEALDRFPGEDREISSVTLGLSKETFLRIKKEIEDFRSHLMKIAEADLNKEQIFQINFQVFPLSKPRGSTK